MSLFNSHKNFNAICESSSHHFGEKLAQCVLFSEKNELFYTYPLITNGTIDLLTCDFFSFNVNTLRVFTCKKFFNLTPKFSSYSIFKVDHEFMISSLHSFSYNNSILHNIFINDPHLKKHDPKVIEKNFDNKKDAYILCKCNKEKIIKINHWIPEIFQFL